MTVEKGSGMIIPLRPHPVRELSPARAVGHRPANAGEETSLS
jgi:hypothetical protein